MAVSNVAITEISYESETVVEGEYVAQLVMTTVFLGDGAGTQGPPGPQGPQGPQGVAGAPGQIRFTGHGPPGTIIGANPLDTYLDLDTGIIYQLT